MIKRAKHVSIKADRTPGRDSPQLILLLTMPHNPTEGKRKRTHSLPPGVIDTRVESALQHLNQLRRLQ